MNVADLMMADMSKRKPERKPEAAAEKGKPPVLYLRITPDDEAALQAYIDAQDTPPDRTAVGLRALRQFLESRGYRHPKTAGP
jgi:hypothetical protein